MEKTVYQEPQLKQVLLCQQYCLMSSGDKGGSGENLQDSVNMTDDDFTSIFG